ncbi:hypothetical protein RDI58_024016 [Solanum bulbocastanum]|uniref:Uncharacterized protein n=1 Tax=Solanum bulbocastanum TaxID=147425 RepID=A0AAN8SXF8_SOLBU
MLVFLNFRFSTRRFIC